MRAVAIASVMAVTQVGGDSVGCSESEPVTVTWTHSPSDPHFGVTLLGCQDWDADVSADRIEVTEGWAPCAVAAYVQDGGLRIESDPVRLSGDEDVQLDFGLPVGPLGGMGAQVVAKAHSVRVERVMAGLPADRAGLVAGDRVLAVDGWSTRHVSTADFVRMVAGDPGTPMVLDVLSAGADEPREVRLQRERLPAQSVRSWHGCRH